MSDKNILYDKEIIDTMNKFMKEDNRLDNEIRRLYKLNKKKEE